MKRYYFILTLKNNPELISEYEEHHKDVWLPEIISCIKGARIENKQIYY